MPPKIAYDNTTVAVKKVLEGPNREQLPEAIGELVLDDQRVRNDICWSVFDFWERVATPGRSNLSAAEYVDTPNGETSDEEEVVCATSRKIAPNKVWHIGQRKKQRTGRAVAGSIS